MITVQGVAESHHTLHIIHLLALLWPQSRSSKTSIRLVLYTATFSYTVASHHPFARHLECPFHSSSHHLARRLLHHTIIIETNMPMHAIENTPPAANPCTLFAPPVELTSALAFAFAAWRAFASALAPLALLLVTVSTTVEAVSVVLAPEVTASSAVVVKSDIRDPLVEEPPSKLVDVTVVAAWRPDASAVELALSLPMLDEVDDAPLTLAMLVLWETN